jgi:hypothetical protein
MLSSLGTSTNALLVALILLIPAVFLLSATQNSSLPGQPRERDFDSALADWAGRRGLHYLPQQSRFVKGVYNHRWFAIGTSNEGNVLRIRMSVKNPRRHSLEIFADWLDRSDVITFVDRFRIYSSPSGLSQDLFARGTRLQDALLRLPELRARLELFSDPRDPNHLDYLLLTDLPGADTVESIMASMYQFCDEYEQAIATLGTAGD